MYRVLRDSFIVPKSPRAIASLFLVGAGGFSALAGVGHENLTIFAYLVTFARAELLIQDVTFLAPNVTIFDATLIALASLMIQSLCSQTLDLRSTFAAAVLLADFPALSTLILAFATA